MDEPSSSEPAQDETIESILEDLRFDNQKQKNFKTKLYAWRTRSGRRMRLLEEATHSSFLELAQDFLKSYGLTFWKHKYDNNGVISDKDEEEYANALLTVKNPSG